MELILIVKDKNQNDIYKYSKKIDANIPIPRKGETICYNEGDAATITRIEWAFDDNMVWIICD